MSFVVVVVIRLVEGLNTFIEVPLTLCTLNTLCPLPFRATLSPTLTVFFLAALAFTKFLLLAAHLVASWNTHHY
jgi:hypothetical protein